MESKLSSVGRSFTPSPIQELSLLAQRCNAINLAEGFPDFPAPLPLKLAAVSAISDDFNQYRHVQGICELLAGKMKQMYGLDVDPLTDVAICCGQTEAFAAAAFAVIDPGDEVVLFDPSYETYEGCIRMAGGIPIYVELDPPHWTLNPDKFFEAFTSRTKAVILNSPQNPTGKVFTKEELDIIAEACCKRDCLAISDEPDSWEEFPCCHVFVTKNQKLSRHGQPLLYSGMQQRTIITSSLSKTFSVTGWRIGWAIAPAPFASAIRNIHIRITDSAPAPFQEAAITALTSPPEYYKSLKKEYESKRDFTVNLLSSLGFNIQFVPQGSFFLFAELPASFLLSDVDYVRELIKQAGVVAVPGRGFFHADLYPKKFASSVYQYQQRYIRFAFCKSDATLAAAAKKLKEISDPSRFIKLTPTLKDNIS